MECKVVNQRFNVKSIIHKNKIHTKTNRAESTNKANKTRVTLFGRKYLIDNKKLEMYEDIGDLLMVLSIIAGIYIIYCVMWLFQ